MRHCFLCLLIAGTVLTAFGCGLRQIQSEVLPRGTPFVLRGTAAVVDDGGPCLIWRGDNGETYQLFQHPSLNNDSFDQVIEPGVTSRLVLVTRSDLTIDCEGGVIVEVQDVLDVEG